MPKRFVQLTNRQPFNAEGNTIIHNVQIAAGTMLVRIFAKLRGTVVLSGGTQAGTATGAENPFGLLNWLDVDVIPSAGSIFPSGKRVAHLSPRACVRRRIFDRGFALADLATPAGITGANGTYNIDSTFEINFALPIGGNPIETAMRLDQFSNVRLTITNGYLANMLSGCNATVNYSNLFWEIYEERSVVDVAGQPPKMPVALICQDEIPLILKAANANQIVNVGDIPQDGPYTDVLLCSESQGALADTIIQQVQVFQGTALVDSYYPTLAKVKQYDRVRDAGQSLTGLLWLNFAPGGRIGSAIPALNFDLNVLNPGGSGNDIVRFVLRRAIAPVTAQSK